jgi:hypothetical protein
VADKDGLIETRFEDRFVERVHDRGETLLRECRRATVPG